MIGHEDIGMKLALMLVASQLKFFKIEMVIRVCAKYLCTVIAAHNDVLGLIGDDESG